MTRVDAHDSQVVPIALSHNWEDLVHIFATLDLSKSQTSRDKDRLLLLGEVQKVTDPSSLNGSLKQVGDVVPCM